MFVALAPLTSWAVLVAILALFLLCLPSVQRWLAQDDQGIDQAMPDGQPALGDVIFDMAAFIDEIEHYLHDPWPRAGAKAGAGSASTDRGSL